MAGEDEEKIMIMDEEEEEMSTTFLPQEIISDILSRLPANSLVSSFKFVCKDWRNLIKDPDFVKMHLNRRRRRASINNSSLICKSCNEPFPFNFEGGLPPPIPIAAATTKTKLDFDPLSRCGSDLVGSCNGLVCLSLDDLDIIIILNPSTRRYKISPIQPIVYPKGDFQSTGNGYGFGCCCYNSNSTTNIDEYKLVRIVYFFDNHSSRSQVDIYSMSSNSWRRDTNIIDFAYHIPYEPSGVFVNEALHWVAASSHIGCETIASFDIRDEEFRQLPIPLSFYPTADEPYYRRHELYLMNMKGCLSMVHVKFGIRHKRIDPDLEIWVMKEYGIQESWTKEFVIRSSDTDPPRALSDFKMSHNTNVYVLKGDQMLIEGSTHTKERIRKLVLYDINERKIDGDFKMIGVPDETPYPLVEQVEHIETLVSLKPSIMAEE